MCCGGNCTGNCSGNKGNFAYVRYASDDQGTNISKYIDKDNNGDLDGVKRCYQSLFVSPVQLDENSALFPTHFTEWSYGCKEDCGCGGCEWFDYHKTEVGNRWSWNKGILTNDSILSVQNDVEGVNNYNGDIMTIPFFKDSDGNLLQSGLNYCFELKFDPTLFTNPNSSVEISFGNGVGSTIISYNNSDISGYIKTTVMPVDGVVSSHTMVIKLVNILSPSGTEIIDFRFFNFRLAPESCCKDGDCGCNCDINMNPQEIIFGDEINFVHTDHGTEVDVITPGVTEITRGLTQSIFNSAIEPGYQSGISPQNTVWNSVFVDPVKYGFSNLSDIHSRNYSDFATALDNNVDSNVIGLELIMHDLNTNKYYKFVFSSWALDKWGGGGFEYTRQEIEVSVPCKITFSDGTTQNTAAGRVVAGTGINVSETIFGGERIFTVSSLGGNVNYSNVIYVDPYYGDDMTAVPGDFTKPFSSINNAVSAAMFLGPSDYNRVLIHIRKGTYVSNVYLFNYVDFYCDPGVVFYGNCTVQDIYGDCISNFYGYAAFESSSSSVLLLNYSSTVNFEFDYIACTGRAIGLNPNVGKKINVNIKGNYIHAKTIGTSHGITIRNNVNLIMNISREIEAVHSTIDFRDHTGNVVINCPKIYLGIGNIYGGNFKQAIIVYDATSQSNILINGDLENKDDTYYGGTSALMSLWGSSGGHFEHNGNIIGGVTHAIRANSTSSLGNYILNGSVSSDLSAMVLQGSGNYLMRNGTVKCNSISTSDHVIEIFGSCSAYFYNSNLYTHVVDSNLFKVDVDTCFLNVNNSTAFSEGSLGELVYSTVPSTKVRLNNVRSNKPLNTLVTDSLVPSGLIVDSNLLVPKF